MIFGASVSEPHTSESNCRFFIYYVYMCISVVRHSVNVGSYSFITIRAPHACMYGQNIEKNACTHTRSSRYMNCNVETYFRVLLHSFTSEFYFLRSFTSEFVVTCFKHEYPEQF